MKTKKQFDFEQENINAWKPLFDEFPQLDILPIYAWGRYYKYELAGEDFELYVDEYGFSKFRHMLRENINWKLLKEIDDLYNKQGGKIWNGDIGDYLPDRDEVVKIYKWDSRSGKCLILRRNSNEIVMDCVDCDSPE